MPGYAIEDLMPVVSPTAFIHPTAVLIGDVIVGDNCYVGPNAVLRSDFGRIVMAAGANLQDTCVVHSFPEKDCVIEADTGTSVMVQFSTVAVLAETRL